MGAANRNRHSCGRSASAYFHLPRPRHATNAAKSLVSCSERLLLAQSVSLRGARLCPELGVKPTCRLDARTSQFDPHVWSGRVLQVDFAELAVSGLASMYPVSDWSCLLRTIMDISARAPSLADRPRSGHLGHQCSHAPGRPNLHLVSSSRRPRLETVDRLRHRLLLMSRSSFVRAKGRSFVPARRTSIASRTGAVKAGRRGWLRGCQAVP